MLIRSLATAVLAAALLLGGLLVPSAGALEADVATPTVVERLDGLPAARAAEVRRPDETGAAWASVSATESAPVEAPIPFSMVGFGLPVDATVWFRTSVDGADWTPWQLADAHPEEGPDPDGDEPPASVSSTPVWVGEARWLQTRVAGTDAGPEDVVVHLIDSAGLGRSWAQRTVDAVRAAWTGGQPAEALAERPSILTRAQWGADESMRSGTVRIARRARVGFVHHTAGSNSYGPGDGPAVVRGIYAYHVRSNGWSDIGYNLLVDRYGAVYEGRYGGLEEAVIGAHAGGFNTGTFGVAVMGLFGSEAPPPPAMDALARVLAWKFDVHHIDPQASQQMTSGGSTRFPAGQTVTLATLSGHRDVSSTACPGGALYAQLGWLRQRSSEIVGAQIVDPDASPATVRYARGASLDGPVGFGARMKPAGSWSLEVRNPTGGLVHAASGSGATLSSSWSPPPAAALGRYSYTITSPGRRTAAGTFELVAPTVRATLTPSPALADRSGVLLGSVSISADLWPGAVWRVSLTDQSGAEVVSRHGIGDRAAATWSGPAAAVPSTYRWRVEADDAPPATGSLDVVADVLRRVGGSGDPVSGAAELSQIAFVDPGSAEHAVVARADVFADALAGGPLAGSVGPLLLTGRDSLDARVRAELERVLPTGATVYVLGGGAALSDAVATDLGRTWRVVRIGGAERTETAANVARVVVANSGATTAMVARSGPDAISPWADALAGGAYGAARGIPVLLTPTDRLATMAENAIRDLGITETVVLGGRAAVGDAAFRRLPGARRVSGADRTETAVAVAEQLWGRTSGQAGDRLLLAGGYRPDAWALSLAASPLAARQNAPLLLTDAGRLSGATAGHLDRLGYGPERGASGLVLGSTAAVSDATSTDAGRRLQ